MARPKIMNGIKISFYIPKEWHDELQRISEENHMTLSDVYRMAIKEFLDRRKAGTGSTGST